MKSNHYLTVTKLKHTNYTNMYTINEYTLNLVFLMKIMTVEKNSKIFRRNTNKVLKFLKPLFWKKYWGWLKFWHPLLAQKIVVQIWLISAKAKKSSVKNLCAHRKNFIEAPDVSTDTELLNLLKLILHLILRRRLQTECQETSHIVSITFLELLAPSCLIHLFPVHPFSINPCVLSNP